MGMVKKEYSKANFLFSLIGRRVRRVAGSATGPQVKVDRDPFVIIFRKSGPSRLCGRGKSISCLFALSDGRVIVFSGLGIQLL